MDIFNQAIATAFNAMKTNPDIIIGIIAVLVIIALIIIICCIISDNKHKAQELQDEQQNRQQAESRYVNLSYKLQDEQQNRKQAESKYVSLSNVVAESQERRKETARRRYVTRDLKQRILERDNYTCQICGISKQYLDNLVPGLGDYLLLEIDHIVPVAKGGRGDDENNLQTLCWRCNRKKGKNHTNAEVKAMIDYGMDNIQRNAKIAAKASIKQDTTEHVSISESADSLPNARYARTRQSETSASSRISPKAVAASKHADAIHKAEITQKVNHSQQA